MLSFLKWFWLLDRPSRFLAQSTRLRAKPRELGFERPTAFPQGHLSDSLAHPPPLPSQSFATKGGFSPNLKRRAFNFTESSPLRYIPNPYDWLDDVKEGISSDTRRTWINQVISKSSSRLLWIALNWIRFTFSILTFIAFELFHSHRGLCQKL